MTGSPRRLLLRSTPAPPLEDVDLLAEILLRLPPNPSSLPRASAVCTRWRGIVSDPVFLRRFHLRHRRSAPVLGCFRTDLQRPRISFVPALEAPNRIPPDRFSLPLGDPDLYYSFRPLNCRHGLVLIFLRCREELLVWDPITGDQHRLAIPQGFVREEERIDGVVIRAAGVLHHFQVVLLGLDQEDRTRAVACVYSSEAGLWGNLVSTLLPDDVLDDTSSMGVPAVPVGDSVYWFVAGGSSRILGFDLHSQTLTVIPVPVEYNKEDRCQFMCMRAEGGGLGFLVKSGWKLQLWNRETDCDAIASWALGRTIELNKLLPLDPEVKESYMLGYAEYSNVVFLWTVIGHFTLQLQSLKFKKTFETNIWFLHQPFECVYTGGMGIGGAPGGADLLHNA